MYYLYCIYTHVSIDLSVCLANTCMYMCVCVHAHIVCMYAHIHACMHVHMYVCVCVHAQDEHNKYSHDTSAIPGEGRRCTNNQPRKPYQHTSTYNTSAHPITHRNTLHHNINIQHHKRQVYTI